MSRLNKKAFHILIAAIGVTVVMTLINHIVSLVQIDAGVQSYMALYEEMGMGGVLSEGAIRGMIIVISVFGLLGVGVWYGLFALFTVRHYKKPSRAIYLTVFLVLEIISGFFSFITIFLSFDNPVGLVSAVLFVLCAGAVIVAYVMHKKAPRPAFDTRYEDEQAAAGPVDPFAQFGDGAGTASADPFARFGDGARSDDGIRTTPADPFELNGDKVRNADKTQAAPTADPFDQTDD